MPYRDSLITWILSSSVISGLSTLLISKILGRKKEDIVIALNYQKYYQNHIDALKVDIKELSDKVEKLLLLVIEKNETINFLKSNK